MASGQSASAVLTAEIDIGSGTRPSGARIGFAKRSRLTATIRADASITAVGHR